MIETPTSPKSIVALRFMQVRTAEDTVLELIVEQQHASFSFGVIEYRIHADGRGEEGRPFVPEESYFTKEQAIERFEEFLAQWRDLDIDPEG